MKFKLIKKDCVDVNAYGKEGISTGGTIDLTGYLAEKAANNPDFEAVKVVKKAVKKK